MEVVGVVSKVSKSGKTLTVERLVGELKRRGYRVATVKHIPKEKFTIDREGSDTWRHAIAGADLVVGLSSDETAFLVKEGKSLHETLAEIEKLGSYDFVIVEGFKKESFPRIVAVRSAGEAEELLDDSTIAVVGALSQEEMGIPVIDMQAQPERLVEILETEELKAKSILARLPVLDCGDCGSASCAEMAEKISTGAKRFEDCVVLSAGREVEIYVGGKEVPLGSFVQDFVRNVTMGMLSSLKKAEVEPGDEVVIRVR